MCVCVCVIFGQVKKFGVIPSGQENHSRAEHLNFPGRELKKSCINFFSSCFWFTPETEIMGSK